MKKKKSLALSGALVIAGSVVSVGAALAASPGANVTFCHATNSVKNPYVVITTDPDSLFKQGHDGHNGPVFNTTMTNKDVWGDIIPAFPYTTEDKKTKVVTAHVYPGKNLLGGGVILANNCNLPGVVPSPSPSVSPSVSVSPSPSVSPSVSASPSVSTSPNASPLPSGSPYSLPGGSPTPSVSVSPSASATPTAAVVPSQKPTKKPKPPVMLPNGHVTPVTPGTKSDTPTATTLPFTGVNTGVYFGFALIAIGMGGVLMLTPQVLTGNKS